MTTISLTMQIQSSALAVARERDTAFAAREAKLHAAFTRGVAGDARAYNACLSDLAGHLRNFFRHKLQRVPDDIEDLVQETLIGIHNQRHTFNVSQPFTAWAYAIARYKLIDRYRQFARVDAQHDALDEIHELTMGFNDDAHEAQHDVAALLRALPEKQRAVIELVKIEGLSVAEASARSGQSESLVKVNIHRGLKALAARMVGKASA